MTTACPNCQRYTAAVQDGGTLRLFDLAPDGFTPTTTPHACGESDRRHP